MGRKRLSTTSNDKRTPLSNISNVISNEQKIKNAAECRRLRKLYLDAKRGKINNHNNGIENVPPSVQLNRESIGPSNNYIHQSSFVQSTFNLSTPGQVQQTPLSNISTVKSNLSRDWRIFGQLEFDAKRQNIKQSGNTNPSTSTNNVFSLDISAFSSTFNNPFNASFSGSTERTPLSNITNVSVHDSNRPNSVEARSFRKAQVDAKRRKLNSVIGLRNQSIVTSGSGFNFDRPSNATSSVQTTSMNTSSHNSILPESSILSNVENCSNGLRSNRRCISPVRMVSLSDEEDMNPQPMFNYQYKGVSKDYLDHGDQTVVCEMCNAKLWKSEAGRSLQVSGRTCYYLCCGYGKVQLPDFKESSVDYQNLFKNIDFRSKYFLKHIRRFNSMFCFTSLGGKVDSNINKGKAPFIYRISGENYHALGGLLPNDGTKPKFSQLYIYDTENEVSNRSKIFSKEKGDSNKIDEQLDLEIIQYLKSMLDSKNQLVKSYRSVRDRFNENSEVNLKLRLIGRRTKDGRLYNLPTSNEIAALILTDNDDEIDNRDIVVESRKEGLQRISELHPKYLALQYPLLIPFGEDCYRVDIPHREERKSKKKVDSKCSMREYFAYHIQDRVGKFSLILNARRLLQQFLVDVYTMIESERLFYVRYQQQKLRCDSYSSLQNVHQNGPTDLATIGTPIILPSSFTGGARYMRENYLDAMAICKKHGYPDFFITITCNPKWPEVRRFLKDKKTNPEDRPDILARLFKLKLDSLMKDLRDKAILGKTSAAVYTNEFQKRGLPHAHICLFLKDESKLPTIDHVDRLVSVEIPDKNLDPELFSLVSDFMIHGPCGPEYPNCPCMIDGKCSKKFPKKFSPASMIDSKGYPVYKRRDSGVFVEKGGAQLDNKNVVPYNPTLLKRYQAHINVEWCNQAASIKYLFKYINKGPDRAKIAFVEDDGEGQEVQQRDEIKKHYDCRFLSACEASWRILKHEVHYRYPPVIRLPFHLPGEQTVVYGPEEQLQNVLNKPSVSSTMFLKWMKLNQDEPVARELSYIEIPSKFVWKPDEKKWDFRKTGKAIGRVHMVNPSMGEAYFLRILLNKVKGPKSFAEIRTVNGKVLPTYRDACYALGLLEDDKEYIEAIEEAHYTGSGYCLRNLFAMMLLSNSLSRPDHVWENTWKYLSDGIMRRHEDVFQIEGLSLPDDQIKNLTLLEIEKQLIRNNSSLRRFPSMPFPNSDSIASANNRLILDELNYQVNTLTEEFHSNAPSLTDEQRLIFDEIIDAVDFNKGGLFFVYEFGGTGKTFLWKTLSAAIRCKGQIVLNVASSGIASLLLSGGRTAHSRFRIPLNVNEESMCSIKANSDEADLLKQTKLIIWDEAPMIHKHAFEALDRTMKDILKSKDSVNSELPFGGKVMVLGGDFRQILPVVPNGSKRDIISASITSSKIWNTCKVRTLTKNMRLTLGNKTSESEEIKEFANWLLQLGEGKVGASVDENEADVDIPDDLLIKHSSDPICSLIDFVYPSLLQLYKDKDYFGERAILAPTNEVVHEINDRLLALFPGDEVEYLSSDSICQIENGNNRSQEDLYSPDVLNGLKISGIPNHRLALKIGVPVMLLRNIDQQNGLCNGTRLRITRLAKRIIEAEIISGGNIGTKTLIPRINMIASDNKIPVKFQRRQFPISVCFAMTINKSQGQSLSKVGLYLRDPVFSHGQLYVALSRVKSRAGVKLLILDADGQVKTKTKNMVYKEIFNDI